MIGQLVADVPSGSNWTPPPFPIFEFKKSVLVLSNILLRTCAAKSNK